ncbi:dihydrolipoyl dehydrogenase [Vallitalea pronyensis]|uniref:Dihydrolipoyl dehydrogenase n=1 Tax=Vallitalea pronyensis TaxID=1348613 RepID=A0A8J8MIC6_9FIRM|nr:dihydrolipoyl dehydrogenase [Vallitalea pronyensis]QUI22164.1 dihydrolipoyl dehydrogenase [Vallitalea pronyensis]
MSIELKIDKLSGHEQQGVIGKIYKQAGDDIAKGDVLFTIESGKGTMKYTSKYTGVLESLDVDEGDTVKKNQVVGHIQGDENQCKQEASTAKAPKKQAYSFGIHTPAKEKIACDVLIIGGGPGGYVAAIRAAQLGKKVVLIEKDKLGGTCLNYGCIPTKALVQSVSVLGHIKESSHYGFDVPDVTININKVMGRKNDVVKQLVSGIQGLMDNNHIRVIHGEAHVKDDQTIGVKTKQLDATIHYQKMIIATGAVPIRIPIPGSDLCEVLTSKEVLELEEIPTSITIIGGGIIGMEIAFIMNALGVEVSVVEYLPSILACLDHDVSDVVRQSAIEKGIHIYDGAKAMGIRKTMNDKMITEIDINDKSYLISSDKVLMAVGRRANLESLDYDKLGVRLNEKGSGIDIDPFMRTSNDDIYAIGDITNKIQLAHVASHQGMIAAEHIAGMAHEMHYDVIPSAIFTMPEVGTVGLSEKEAQEKEQSVNVVKFPFFACGKAIAMNEPEGFVKLIVAEEDKRLLGGAIVGAHSTDLIATITQLIQDKVTVEEALKVVYAHPTLGESIHEALLMADDRGIHFG